jgi:hypothetical protein
MMIVVVVVVVVVTMTIKNNCHDCTCLRCSQIMRSQAPLKRHARCRPVCSRRGRVNRCLLPRDRGGEHAGGGGALPCGMRFKALACRTRELMLAKPAR